jgi:hypothetical protein
MPDSTTPPHGVVGGAEGIDVRPKAVAGRIKDRPSRRFSGSSMDPRILFRMLRELLGSIIF